MTDWEPLFRGMETERTWLSRQPHFRDNWEAGTAWASTVLRSWVEGYGRELFGHAAPAPLAVASATRLWSVWAHHWRLAAEAAASRQIDGLEVAARLREGVRPTTRQPMGGDPLRDAVLVEGCLARESRALERLHSEYQDTFESVARETIHRAVDLDQWHDLVTHLAGLTRHSGERRPLEGFVGYSSLRAWLRPTVRHSLWDHVRAQRSRTSAETRGAWARADHYSNAPDPDETLELFRQRVTAVFSGLDYQDRLLLLLSVREGWQNQVIADRLQRSAGQVSRLRQQAIERFCRALRSSESLREVLEDLEGTDSALAAYALVQGLQDPQLTVDTGLQFTSQSEEEMMPHTAKKPAKKTPQAKQKPKNPPHIQKLTKAKPVKAQPVKAKPTKPLVKAMGSEPSLAKPSGAKHLSERIQTPSQPRVATASPDPLARLLPRTVDGVGLDQVPEEYFAQILALAPEKRPGVICLDARGRDATATRKWLERLDAVLYERDGGAERYAPRRAIILDRQPSSIPELAELKSRPDLSWVVTTDEREDAASLYEQRLRKTLGAFLQPDVEGLFAAEPESGGTSAAESVPPKKRKEWLAWVEAVDASEEE